MEKFKRGDQIKYDGGHGEVEYGFVTEDGKMGTFCRFWSNDVAGQLRTMANSESCNERSLSRIISQIPQVVIDAWLQYLGY